MPSNELLEIVMPALFAGLLVALTHAPLGIEVLRRGIIFIDLAIAQVAGLGLVVAHLIFIDANPWIFQAGALLFALAAAFAFRFVEKKMPDEQEAIIGSVFVIAASLSILFLAQHPHGGEEIEHLLSGQILFITWHDILLHAPIYAVIVASWFVKHNVRKGVWFYILFALAITSSVQLVGVYVVFASLILPAIAVHKLSRKITYAWLCGITSVFAGIVISVMTDIPSGPVIVCCYAAVTLLVRLVITGAKRKN